MFTGIIQETSKVMSVSKTKGGLRVNIAKPAGWKIKPGESVAVDGICSTIARINRRHFEVEYMPETIKKTTAASFKKNKTVNLEQSLGVNSRIDGHLVQGHVDAVGAVKEISKTGNSVILKVAFPEKYRKFISEKGAICANGVSLTIVDVGKNWFSVSLVSYTLRHTNLQGVKKGDKVNIEVDILARYLNTLLNYDG